MMHFNLASEMRPEDKVQHPTPSEFLQIVVTFLVTMAAISLFLFT